MVNLTQLVKEKAVQLGFDMVGIVSAHPSPTLSHYLAWISAEMHGSMGYMARPDRVARRQEPQRILPALKTIICVGLSYATQLLPPHIASDPRRGRIANYAWSADYHAIMTPRLTQLAHFLREAAPTSQSKVYVDTGAILERSHAQEAGLGFVGKNTMLIAPRAGSFFFLGELLTTCELEPDPLQSQPSCGHCHNCLTACPTQAFPAPYLLDARRCISYLTIEHKGVIDEALRPLMGNWVYGCDVCQLVCPFNRFATPTSEPSFRPTSADAWDEMAPPLLDLLALDGDSFAQRFAYSPILRIGRDRLVRNACIAAGNSGDLSAEPQLQQLAQHDPSPLVREHAQWALTTLTISRSMLDRRTPHV